MSDDAVQAPADMKVWRKEVLGFGGVLYGQPTVHFEIFATDDNSTNSDFKKFWRDRTTIQPGQHGSDDVFGNMHFVIPANRQFSERHPQAVEPHRIRFANENKFFELDTGQAGQNTQRLHVVVELDKGKRTATTYSLDEQGQLTGQVGTPVVQQDYEYELYRLATALYTDCPSAGFEYLRFGRILGPDSTTRIENWQLVRYSETGMGYINLAEPDNQVSVLSDADFPLHWQALQEGTAASPTDGIANVAELSNRLQLPDQPSGASLFAAPEFAARANAAGAAEALRHFICKHPSEWDASDLETRYASLRQAGKPLQDQTAWDNFEKHVEAMAFWPQSGVQNRSVWHFHPLEFVRIYKKCGWRSKRELLQLVPLNIIRKPGSHESPSLGYWESPSIGPARNLINLCATELNNSLRKFCIDTPIRQSCFFGNSVQETQWFRTLKESNGNQPELHMGWYGRGFLQLTNPNGEINNGNNNYYKYFKFLGRNPLSPPGAIETSWRDQIANQALHAAQSAGAYWIWPNKSAPTRQNPSRPTVDNANKYADQFSSTIRKTISISGSATKVWYYNQSFANCAAAVNYPAMVGRCPPNMNGLIDRSTAFVNALVVLSDSAHFPDAQNTQKTEPENYKRRELE